MLRNRSITSLQPSGHRLVNSVSEIVSCIPPKTYPQDSQHACYFSKVHFLDFQIHSAHKFRIPKKRKANLLDTILTSPSVESTNQKQPTLIKLKLDSNKTETKTKMSRSILATLLVVFLFTMNTNPALGLVGVLNRVRSTGIWGRRVKTTRSQYAHSLLPAQMPKEATGDQPTVPPQTETFFDADSYRQEMINLVYERSVQRMVGH